MSRETAALRETALALAEVADGLAMARFGGPVAATAKPDGSPVTAADREIEAALRAELARAHPDHAVLGEEEGGALDAEAPTWVIDPIDATKNYLRGVPVFATLIAVVVDGRAVVGVASAPALGERWDAAEGLGARRNGTRVGVSAIAEVAEAHLCHGGLTWFRDEPGAWARLGGLVDTAWRTRGFGDFWMHLLVAGGMAEAAFERDLSVWDLAALLPIVTEAGGTVSAFDGGDPLSGDGSLLSSNGRLHETVRRALVG
ncbi:MAG: inositol monophosphatase family protein [Actinomycetota bacterium]